MDHEPQVTEETKPEPTPPDMSLNDFVSYARTLQSESCPSCGAAEAGPDGGRCQACAAPSFTDRLGPIGKLWRRIAYRLGLA